MAKDPVALYRESNTLLEEANRLLSQASRKLDRAMSLKRLAEKRISDDANARALRDAAKAAIK